MRHAFQATALAAFAAALAACGSAPYDLDHPAGLQPRPPTVELPPIQVPAAPGTYDPTDMLQGAGRSPVGPQQLRPQGRLLASVFGRLYFIAHTGEEPAPDGITLRAIGTEAVTVRAVAIVDDVESPFGLGAASHFTTSLPPGPHVIEPGTSLQVQVRFLGDTTELQNAVLELRTDAENLPLIRVALIGKMLSL